MIRKPKTKQDTEQVTAQVLSLISVMKEGKYNKQQYFLTQKDEILLGHLGIIKKRINKHIAMYLFVF